MATINSTFASSKQIFDVSFCILLDEQDVCQFFLPPRSATQFKSNLSWNCKKYSKKKVHLHFGAKPSARQAFSNLGPRVGGRISSFIMAHASRAREDFSLMQEKLNVLFPGRQHQIQQLLHLIGKVPLFHF